MNEITGLLLDLFIIYTAARIAAEAFERLGQPVVVGELLAGVLIGPYALGLIGHADAPLVALFHDDPVAAGEALELVYELLAEIGVIVLLFYVGLETRFGQLLRVGVRSLLVGVLGVIVPFGLALGLMLALGYPGLEAVFVAVAAIATSVGITARVMRDMGVLSSVEARIILGAAVIDDILAMIFLAIVTSLAGTGVVDPVHIGLIALQALAFTVFTVLVGLRWIRRYDLHLDFWLMDHPALSFGLLIMLGLAGAAGAVGLAAIIGAFLAGMVLADSKQQPQLHRQLTPIYHFLVPLFFVITGSHVDWRVFVDPTVLGLGLSVTAVAIAGKLIGGGLPLWGMGRRSMAIVGVGMVPRGEVGLIVASIGLRLDVFPEDIFSVVVVMSILTTLFAPPILRRLYPREPSGGTLDERGP